MCLLKTLVLGMLLLLATFSVVWAGVGTGRSGTGVSLAGTWRGETNESIISITDKDGFLDVLGKDSASIYTSVCLLPDSQAQCSGSGMNHSENKRFMYSSKLILEKNGNLTEQWEATFAGGQKIQGRETFTRQQKPTR